MRRSLGSGMGKASGAKSVGSGARRRLNTSFRKRGVIG